MTPDEANQARHAAAVTRARRIELLSGLEALAILHRIAVIEPAVVDRTLIENEVLHLRVHPVRFRRSGTGITAYCDPCGWRAHLENGHTLDELQRLVYEHSGIGSPCLAG